MSTLRPHGLPPLSPMRETAIRCPHCHLASTHVEAQCRRCGAALANSTTIDAWRRGKRLVARKGTTLPHRCVKCNAKAEGTPFVHQLSYVPLAAYILIIFWLLPFLIAVMILQKKTTLVIGLCAEHHARRRSAKRALIASIVAAPLLWIAAATQGSALLGWLGVLVLVGGVAWAIWGMRMVAATKMDDHFVRVAGVNREYLASLPDWKAAED